MQQISLKAGKELLIKSMHIIKDKKYHVLAGVLTFIVGLHFEKDRQ